MVLIKLRDFLAVSWTNSFVASLLAALLLLPFVLIPLSKLLTTRKRSINRNIYNNIPADYWFNAIRAVGVIVVFTTLLFGFAARDPLFVWNLNQITMQNTIGAGAYCFFIREFLNYWSHRFMHCRLLYKYVHRHHHEISHPGSGALDGIYGHPVDSVVGMAVLYIPFYTCKECHITTLLVYFFMYAFFGIILNHCGREFRIAFHIAGREVKLYDTADHDDHHVYRHGNYSDFFPMFDVWFGTNLVIETRRSLPAAQLWAKLRRHVLSGAYKESELSFSRSVRSSIKLSEIAEIEAATQRRNPSSFASPFAERSRSILAQLLKEHPDCCPDSALMVHPNVMERRKSTVTARGSVTVSLSSIEGRRLSILDMRKSARNSF